MAKQLFGKAALSLVRTASGSVDYVYAGAPVPAGADEADVARLVDEGFLVVVGEDEPEEKPARRSSSRGSRSSKPAEQSGGEAGGAGAQEPDATGGESSGDEAPPKASGKEAWVEFAVSQRADGVSEEDARSQAEALTKNELIARFGA